jgi:hypothetical protein
MNNCFVIRHIKTGAYHTVIKEAKPAIISFSTIEQALTFSKLVNEVNKPKQTSKLPIFSRSVKDLFVTKKTTINTLSKQANLSCLDVLLLGEDYTYTLYPATCVDTLDNDEFRYYLENKFQYDQ